MGIKTFAYKSYKVRNIKRSEFLVISTGFAIFDRRYLAFLTDGSKGGRDRKVEKTVLMSRMEGLMDRDRQPGRITRWKARLLLEMDRHAINSTQTRCWE